jgi:hypothetical protein
VKTKNIQIQDTLPNVYSMGNKLCDGGLLASICFKNLKLLIILNFQFGCTEVCDILLYFIIFG